MHMLFIEIISQEFIPLNWFPKLPLKMWAKHMYMYARDTKIDYDLSMFLKLLITKEIGNLN